MKEGTVAPGTLGCPKPGPLKCFCAPRHQILAKCAGQKAYNCDKAKFATKLRQLSAPKYAYLAKYAYLGTPNMVQWGVPEKILQNAVALTLCQYDPPVKSYDQISFFAGLSH